MAFGVMNNVMGMQRHDDAGLRSIFHDFGRGFLTVVLLLVMSATVVCLMGCDRSNQQALKQHQLQKTHAQATFEVVTLAGETFTLQLALNDDSRFQGLSDVKEIPRDGGMLFVFPRPRELNFVMRKCLVPIDLIYLGPGGRIVSMHKMQTVPYDTPESQLPYYSSGWPSQFVIELREGSIDRLMLKIGQKIDLPLAELKNKAS